MMVLHRREERIEHRRFAELPEFLAPGDLLVLNNTRVVNARRFSDDGKVEFLFLEKQALARWKCLVRPGRKMRVGAETIMGGIAVRVDEICPDGERIVSLDRDVDPWEGGMVPLPPYLRRQGDTEDLERYQTVFANAPGAVAAPTAGLHFTPQDARDIAACLHNPARRRRDLSAGEGGEHFRTPDARGNVFHLGGRRDGDQRGAANHSRWHDDRAGAGIGPARRRRSPPRARGRDRHLYSSADGNPARRWVC